MGGGDSNLESRQFRSHGCDETCTLAGRDSILFVQAPVDIVICSCFVLSRHNKGTVQENITGYNLSSQLIYAIELNDWLSCGLFGSLPHSSN